MRLIYVKGGLVLASALATALNIFVVKSPEFGSVAMALLLVAVIIDLNE